MIDNEHDSIGYDKLLVWSGILTGSVAIWYSIFTNGFFVTLMWLIVIAAIIGIVIKMWDMRI